MDDYESLSHSKWECKYHVVFIPKCRRRTLYVELRRQLGEVFRRVGEQKESRIEEGHLLADHVHMLISIPPKYAVSQVIGFIKGKSAIHLARVYGERKRNFVGQHFWARGYFVSTVALGDKVPVLLAGGAADGRGLAAAIMLGAQGIVMGTRFHASVEAAGHEAAKQRILSASGDETVRSVVFDISRNNVWPHPFTGRCLANMHSKRWLGRELELMRREDVIAEFAGARQTGNFDIAPVIAGEAVALIRDIRSANEIVWRTVAEAERLLAGGSHCVTKENSAAA